MSNHVKDMKSFTKRQICRKGRNVKLAENFET